MSWATHLADATVLAVLVPVLPAAAWLPVPTPTVGPVPLGPRVLGLVPSMRSVKPAGIPFPRGYGPREVRIAVGSPRPDQRRIAARHCHGGGLERRVIAVVLAPVHDWVGRIHTAVADDPADRATRVRQSERIRRRRLRTARELPVRRDADIGAIVGPPDERPAARWGDGRAVGVGGAVVHDDGRQQEVTARRPGGLLARRSWLFGRPAVSRAIVHGGPGLLERRDRAGIDGARIEGKGVDGLRHPLLAFGCSCSAGWTSESPP